MDAGERWQGRNGREEDFLTLAGDAVGLLCCPAVKVAQGPKFQSGGESRVGDERCSEMRDGGLVGDDTCTHVDEAVKRSADCAGDRM